MGRCDFSAKMVALVWRLTVNARPSGLLRLLGWSSWGRARGERHVTDSRVLCSRRSRALTNLVASFLWSGADFTSWYSGLPLRETLTLARSPFGGFGYNTRLGERVLHSPVAAALWGGARAFARSCAALERLASPTIHGLLTPALLGLLRRSAGGYRALQERVVLGTGPAIARWSGPQSWIRTFWRTASAAFLLRAAWRRFSFSKSGLGHGHKVESGTKF